MENYHLLKDSRSNHYAYVNLTKSPKTIYFLPTGKTGGTFFRNTLNFKLHWWDPYGYESNSENIEQKVWDVIKDNISIIIIRNPLNKLISSYLEITKPREETKQITINMIFYKILQNKINKKTVFDSFNNFLDVLINNNKYDPHMWNQTEILQKWYGLKGDDIEKYCNHILFNETLTEDSNELSELYNLENNRHPNSNIGDNQLKKLVEQIIDDSILINKMKIILKKDMIFYNTYAKKVDKYEKLSKITQNFDVYMKLLD